MINLFNFFLPFFFVCQVEVDWEKIQAKIKTELTMERERAANVSVRSSVASHR